MNKVLLIIAGLVLALGICFRVFCGVFVIQPIGAVPEGTTIVYWKGDLDLPFITSADGVLIEKGANVSLLTRGLTLAAIGKPILDNEMFRMPYSKTLYLWSTGGKEFTK